MKQFLEYRLQEIHGMLVNTKITWNAFHKISLMKRQFQSNDHLGGEKLKRRL